MESSAPVRLAVFGFGNRVRKYLKYLDSHQDEVELAAVIEIDGDKLEMAKVMYSLPESCCFSSPDAFFKCRPSVDAVIIGSPDDTHHELCMRSLDCGYHVLLEKPAAQTLVQCREILEKSFKCNIPVMLCYVLRYHPMYVRLKAIVDGGSLGDIISINHVVNVGIDRTTHTFVRGPWGNSNTANPMILSKCCHDVDLIVWLTGAVARKVSSFGSLKWFRKENAPEGSAQRCIDCSIESGCPFSAVDLYRRRHEWIANFNVQQDSSLDETIEMELESGRYGRCVYHCGNDVVDHQVLSMLMDNDVVVTLSMDCFTMKDDRVTDIKCVYGEVVVRNNVITIYDFRSRKVLSEDFTGLSSLPFHANADLEIVGDFLRSVKSGTGGNMPVMSSSMESHRICFLAEDSRLSGMTIEAM